MRDIIEMWKKRPSFLTAMVNNRARLLTTLGGALLIFVFWQLSLILVPMTFAAVSRVLLAQSDTLDAGQEALGISLLLIFGFGPAFIVTMLWRKIMERRAILTLFTGRRRFRWWLTACAIILIGSLGLALTIVFDSDGLGQIQARMGRLSPQDWALLALAYGVGIGVQSTFEEVLMRGWLLQHLARFLVHGAAAVVVCAIVFTASHAGAVGWATYAAALVFGLAYGWSAVRLNGLEAAIGAHIGNNLVAALLGGGMINGNAASMTGMQMVLYGLYVLGFLLFVEGWARIFPASDLGPARIGSRP